MEENFNALTVDLEGVNLVEASAGTGKTYSVALLVLRLIVEKNIPIDKILMVTFTNAAVAEMATRIRKFIRLALDRANGKQINEPTIASYIDQILKNEDSVNLKRKLNNALVALDEASIQTIHSFCQDSLNAFAFETGQGYGLKLQEDLSDIASRFVEDYWRTYVTGLAPEVLQEWNADLKMDVLKKAVSNVLSGKEYFYPFTSVPDPSEKQRCWQEFLDYHSLNLNRLRSEMWDVDFPRFNEKVKQSIEVILMDPQAFFSWLTDGKRSNYKDNLLDDVFEKAKELADEIPRKIKEISNQFISHCISEVKAKIELYLKNHHLLTYDAMIDDLHTSVLESEDLREKLGGKYEAVFIDEFQDTDQKQYDIYDKLYGINKILFYIGDPKQSIYGWRKADLETYFKAQQKEGVIIHKMNTNFRSTQDYVSGMNEFFDIENPFLDNKIEYLPVESNARDDKKGLRKGEKILMPIQIFQNPNKGDIGRNFGILMRNLLSEDLTLDGKPVKKSDIGILVRTKNEGREIKKRLTALGIHAVNVDETKIFETAEAQELCYILETVLDISWQGVNRALLNPFTGYDVDKILTFDSDKLVSLFKIYQEVWLKDGILPMMSRYMQDFQVASNLSDPSNSTGIRKISNLHQLIEILQEQEYKKELKPTGILSYLKKQLENQNESEDVYLQRLESDQDAVTIMTIHKAKGLEFPIVIAPFLDFKAQEKFEFSSYRDQDQNYLFYRNGKGSEDAKAAFLNQAEQENRRLVYVAITRAIYNCFVFRNTSGKSNPSALLPFVNPKSKVECFAEGQFPHQPCAIRTEERNQEIKKLDMPDFKLTDSNWRKMSFSFLSRKQKGLPKIQDESELNSYDQFVFRTLPKGAALGDLLHEIFERIDFSDSENHEESIRKSLKKHFPEREEEFLEFLKEMVHQIVNARIFSGNTSFSLNDISRDSRVSEWEFDLKCGAFNPAGLMGLGLPEGHQVLTSDYTEKLQGLLNGFVDLIFEHEGKYFILDWKSNFLGGSQAEYKPENLLMSMNDNNYHLQYLLYSVALKKYLGTKIPGFDYESQFGGVLYYFLRGIRSGSDHGIFYQKPSLDLLESIESLISGESIPA